MPLAGRAAIDTGALRESAARIMNDLVVGFSVERPFVLRVRVDDEHIDGQGHASNVAFVDWMNRAAIEHSAALGLDLAAYQRLGAMFVVRRHEIDYVRPARAGDQLLCATWIERMEKASAERRHEIVRAGDGELIARGRNMWAFVRRGDGAAAADCGGSVTARLERASLRSTSLAARQFFERPAAISRGRG